MKSRFHLNRFHAFAILIVLVLSLAASPRTAFAEDNIEEKSSFTAQHWTRGLHMMAGLGVNSAYFTNDIQHKQAGLGLNINTSVGYYFLNDYAIEASTNVMFNRVRRTLIWNTLGLVGLRFRIPTYIGPANSHPYIRLAAGKGPSVFIIKGQKPDYLDRDGDRTQIEGDIASATYGIFQNARDGTTWWLELSGTVHTYRKIETIRDNLTVPEVIDSKPVTDNSAMYAIALTFGVVVL